jgi:hypothetical protein
MGKAVANCRTKWNVNQLSRRLKQALDYEQLRPDSRVWKSSRWFLTLESHSEMSARYRELKVQMESVKHGSILQFQTCNPVPAGLVCTILHFRVWHSYPALTLPESYLWFRMATTTMGVSMNVELEMLHPSIIQLPAPPYPEHGDLVQKMQCMNAPGWEIRLAELEASCMRCELRPRMPEPASSCARNLNESWVVQMGVHEHYPSLDFSPERLLVPNDSHQIPITTRQWVHLRLIPHALPTGMGESFQDGNDVRLGHDTCWSVIDLERNRQCRLKPIVLLDLLVSDLTTVIASYFHASDLVTDRAFILSYNHF